MDWKLPKPFDYLERGYRAFLRDWLEARRRQPGRRTPFSLQMFASEARLSRSALPNVIQGRERLSDARLNAFCRALHLSPEEERFFRLLVERDQRDEQLEAARASQEDPARPHLRRAAESRARAARALQVELELAQLARQNEGRAPYRYLSKPHLALLREILIRLPDVGDLAWLGQQLLPPVSVDEVESALITLQEMALLERAQEGGYYVPGTTLFTDSKSDSLGIYEFHRATVEAEQQVLALESEAMREGSLFREHSRFFSGVLWIPEGKLQELGDRLEAFHAELLLWADHQETCAGRLYRSALRLVPASAPLDPARHPRPAWRR